MVAEKSSREQHKPLTAAEITRFDVIVNGDRGMLPHPDGEYVRYTDVLSMLQPPADAAADDLLTRCCRSLDEKLGRTVEYPSSCSQQDQPADAAVREAVERLRERMSAKEHVAYDDVDTLLSYVRAAQAPRLTGERLEAVRHAKEVFAASGDVKIANELDAAFPELGEG